MLSNTFFANSVIFLRIMSLANRLYGLMNLSFFPPSFNLFLPPSFPIFSVKGIILVYNHGLQSITVGELQQHKFDAAGSLISTIKGREK